MSLRPGSSPILSCFEGLPRDMLWKIIEYVPEAVLDLRRTSRAMKLGVDDYVTLPGTIRLFDKVKVFEIAERGYATISVQMCAPKRKYFLFELRLIKRIGFRRRNYLNKYASFYDRDEICYSFNYNKVTNDDLLGIMGRRIGTVSLTQRIRRSQFHIVSKLLNGTIVQKFEIDCETLKDSTAHRLLDIFNNLTIDQLSLQVVNARLSKPVAFLFSLSSLFRSLHLKQYSPPSGIDRDSNYFLGVRNGNWAAIIPEMFSEKMDTLFIQNYACPGYLNRQMAESLAKSLPLNDKKLWFTASFREFGSELVLVTEGYSIRVGKSREGGIPDVYIKIKHLSRMQEHFDIN